MKLSLRIAISVLVLVLLFTYVVDGRQVLTTLGQMHPAYLLLAFSLVTLDRMLMTYKWTVLLRAQGHRLPFWQAVAIYCTSQLWGSVLPATIGADALRAVMLAKRGVSGTDAVTSIIVERLIGFVLALVLGIVSLTVLRQIGVLDARYDPMLYIGLGVLVAAIATLTASMNEKWVALSLRLLPAIVRHSRLMQKLIRITDAYHALGTDRKTLLRFAGLTACEQQLAIVVPWVIALGLDIHASLLLLLGVMPVSTLLSRLPISFDGIGVYEAIFIGLMMLAGITPAAALAMALAGRIIQILAFLPWWAVYAGTTSCLIGTPTAQENGPQCPSQAN